MGSKKRLPQMAGGWASALSLSRPAQASLTLRPAGSLSRPQATFVTRLQPMRLPAQAARQLPDQSTTLRVDSSSTDDSRLRGALPQTDPEPGSANLDDRFHETGSHGTGDSFVDSSFVFDRMRSDIMARWRQAGELGMTDEKIGTL